MATTINEASGAADFDKITALQEPLVGVLLASPIPVYKFRYILQIYVNNAAQAKIKQQKNPLSRAIIDAGRIIRSFELPKYEQSAGNPIHNANVAVQGTGIVKYIELKAGQESATSATSNPTQSLADDTQTFYCLMGKWQFKDGVKPDLTPYIYQDNTDKIKYLTSAPLTVKARLEDYGMIAFMNADLESPSSPIDTLAYEITFFDSAGVQIGLIIYKEVVAHLSGSTPVDALAYADEDNVGYYLPFAPANIEAITGVTIPSNAASYTLLLYDDAGQAVWETKTVELYEDCKYTTTRLGWSNEFNAWDYFNFELAHTETINISRKKLTKPFGSWGAAYFEYQNHERGESIYDISGEQQFTVTSNWLNDADFIWLKSMLMSKDVQVQDGNKWFGIVITDSSFELKQDIKGQLNNLTLTYKMANKLR